MLSVAISRLSPSPRSRSFALLSALFRLRRHGVVMGMFMLRAGENGAGRSFVIVGVFRFSCHGMDGAGVGLPCRADGVGGSSCLP